ncbi:MAG: hemin uptake protein HemP [Pseudomonadota bacterium]
MMRHDSPDQFRTGAPVSSTDERVVDSADLMQGARIMHIRHGDQVYTLRVTRQGKLLLTK